MQEESIRLHYRRMNSGLLEEKPVLLTAEPSLQPISDLHKYTMECTCVARMDIRKK